MRATRHLPEDYHRAGSLDISEDARLQVLLTVAGAVLFVGFGWLFLFVLGWMRPDVGAMGMSLEVASVGQLLSLVLVLALVVAGVIVLHEAVHGLFFWLITGSKPVFRFRVVFASAGAPDWYLPCRQYTVVGVAPLVVITGIGLILLAAVPHEWLPPALLFLSLNAGGSVGDLAVVVWLRAQPPTCVANDRGDRVTLYRPRS
ncbi:MAG: DUF3267 domain-containing protein [Anaerolineae bacterium]|nr:DUF3267 domain-containing protein [Anaerolineae bacterium]